MLYNVYTVYSTTYAVYTVYLEAEESVALTQRGVDVAAAVAV